MYLKRKIGSVFFILLLLVACSGSEPADETVDTNLDNDGNTTITNEATNATNDEPEVANTIVTFAVNEYERGLYASRVEAFEQANPEITIEIVNMGELTEEPYNLYYDSSDEKAIETALDLVKSADVIAMSPTPLVIEQKLVLNLEPLITTDSQINTDDFYPGVLEQYQREGGIWALPLTSSYTVIVYDKSKFDAANLSYPEAGWNWADFVATAQALTNTEAEDVQWGFTASYLPPIDLIEARAGHPFIDASTEPPTINFEHPDVVAAFQWFSDLAHVHGVMPIEDETEVSVASGGRFGSSEGNVGMWLENSGFMDWDSLEARNLGIVPLPVSTASDKTSPISTFFGPTNAFVISSGSTKTDEAWAWLKFLSQQSVETGFFDTASLPARQSAAEASGFWNDIPEEFVDTLRYVTEHTFTPSQLPQDGRIYGVVYEIVQEEKDVATVLATLQTEIEAAVQKQTEAVAEATAVPEFTVAEPPSAQVPEGATVIKFVVMGGLPDVYRESAKAFQEAHPDIVVKVEEPNYFSGDFSIASLMGEADCFQSFSSLDSPDDLQAVLSIQPFLDADPELTEADYYPALVNAFSKQGQIMGLPGEATVRVLAYDKRLFDAIDYPYPSSDWTVDEFLETAVALTQGDGDDKIYGFRPTSYSEVNDLILMMDQLGAKLIDDSVDPPQTNFTHPDTIAAMRWYTNLTTEYGVKPLPDTSDGFGASIDFSEEDFDPAPGNVAIWADEDLPVFFSDEDEAVEQDSSHIGYVLYPTGPNGSAGYENVTGFFISRETEHRQACWEWIKFASSDPALFQFGTPAKISVAESSEYSDRVGEEKAALLRNALSRSEQSSTFNRFSRSASWLGFSISWLEEAHRDIVLNDVSVEEAMQAAQTKADALRNCVIERDIFTDFEKQFECIQEIDPDIFG